MQKEQFIKDYLKGVRDSRKIYLMELPKAKRDKFLTRAEGYASALYDQLYTRTYKWTIDI